MKNPFIKKIQSVPKGFNMVFANCLNVLNMTGKFHIAVVFNIDQAVVVFAWKEAKIEDLKGCSCKAEEHLESKISVRRRRPS